MIVKRRARLPTLIVTAAVILCAGAGIAVATAWVVSLAAGSKGQGQSQAQPVAPSPKVAQSTMGNWTFTTPTDSGALIS